jgi:hypothetical protein
MFAIFTTLKTGMSAFIGTITTVAMAALGWAININSKVNVAQQQNKDLQALIETKFDLIIGKFDARFDDFDRRLERVERHVLNGHYEGTN